MLIGVRSGGPSKKSDVIVFSMRQLSGLKINFHKSKLVCFGGAKGAAAEYAELFDCEQGQFHIFAILVFQSIIGDSNTDWKYEERIKKHIIVSKRASASQLEGGSFS